MTSKELSNGLLRTIAILAGIVATLYCLFELSTLIIYFIISILLLLIANPIVDFLTRKCKFKKTLAVLTTLIIFLSVIFGTIMLFVPLIIAQGENLSLLDLAKMEENYKNALQGVNEFFITHGYNFSKALDSANFFKHLDLEFIPQVINSVASLLGSFGMALASILFITFFFLKEKDDFYDTFQSLLPEKQRDRILNSISEISVLLSRYFTGLLVQLSIIFGLNFIVFLIFGVQNAFIIALLCAILNIIPYIGPLLGMVVAGTLILLSGIGHDYVHEILPKIMYVLIGMGIVQLIDNNFNQPIIFSRSTKSHPLEIFLVILAAGTLFGITGMIVAVPAYTVLKVIAKEFYPNNKIVKALTKNM